MNNYCPYQSKIREISSNCIFEIRCIIPFEIENTIAKNSLLCEYKNKEKSCPILISLGIAFDKEFKKQYGVLP